MNDIKKYITMNLLFHFIEKRNKYTITFIDFYNISFRISENLISCSYIVNNCLYPKSIFKFWKIFNQYFINLNPFRGSHFSLQSFFKVENIAQLGGLRDPKAFPESFAAIISYCIFCCIRKSTKK
jgi:hypothetical protein